MYIFMQVNVVWFCWDVFMPFFYLTHEFFLSVAHGLILFDKYKKKIRLCFQKWSIFTVLLGWARKYALLTTQVVHLTEAAARSSAFDGDWWCI
jgi:hypothetical protein